MKTSSFGVARVLCPAIVLALAVAYLMQVAPHGHGDDVHEDAHPTHHAHANHSHAPVGDADEQGSSDTSHHHHSESQHLDFHSIRPALRTVDQEPGDLDYLTVLVEPIPVVCRYGFATAKPDQPVPDDPLPRHAPSRAPPA